MANCPKCGYHLKLTDWRPECPKCNVNLLYYQMEERLRQDADKAEHEYARNKPRMDRLKASVFGSSLAKLRLPFLILPILALLLPLGKVSLSLPFNSSVTTVNLVSVINTVSDLDFGLLFKLIGSNILGNDFLLYFLSILFLVLALLCMILNLVFLVMSFGKKGLVRNVSVNSLGIVFVAASMLCFALLGKGLAADVEGLVSVSLGWGGIGVIACFAALIIINIMFKVKKIEVQYTDVSEYLLPYHERKAYKEEQERLANESEEAKAKRALEEAEARLKQAQQQTSHEHAAKH